MPIVVGIILAAGCSSRMGPINKLTREWNGKPLLLHSVEAALSSRLDRVVVVTGHEAELIRALLPSSVGVVHNAEYKKGMASSLRKGVEAAQEIADARGVLVMLGDMPLLTSAHMNQIISTFENATNGTIVQASAYGMAGNPVLFPADQFANLLKTEGDRGAKSLLEKNQGRVERVEIGDAASRDFDTPAAFEA